MNLSLLKHDFFVRVSSFGKFARCMCTGEANSVSKLAHELNTSVELENLFAIKIIIILQWLALKQFNTNPPSKSVLSLCWFMLMTRRLHPSCWDKYWTEDVFPVPVSPTSKTGSFFVTQTATFSNKDTAWRVKAKLAVCLLASWEAVSSLRGRLTLPTVKALGLISIFGLYLAQ